MKGRRRTISCPPFSHQQIIMKLSILPVLAVSALPVPLRCSLTTRIEQLLFAFASAQPAEIPSNQAPSSSSAAPTTSASSPASSATSVSGSQSISGSPSQSGNVTSLPSTSVPVSLSTAIITSQLVTVSGSRTITLNTTIQSVATSTLATTRNLTQISATPTQLLSITAFAPGQSVSGINLGPGDGAPSLSAYTRRQS